MRRGIFVVLFFSLIALSFPLRAADLSEQAVADAVKSFSAEIQCGPNSQDVWRLWCPVTLLGKTAFSAPSAPTTLVGISMSLHQNAKVIPALQQTTDLAVLTLSSGSAKVTDLRPSNEQEKQELIQVLMSLSTSLKGMSKKDPIPVTSGLADFLKGENSKSGNSYKVDKNSAVYSAKLPTRIYKVPNPVYGDAYVAVEQAADGLAISIFPTVGYKAK